MDRGSLIVTPPEIARVSVSNMFQLIPARVPTRPPPSQYSPPIAAILRSPATQGVLVRSASKASENGPWRPDGKARGANAAPTLTWRAMGTGPRGPSNSGLRRFLPVTPRRTLPNDMTAPASKSTFVRDSSAPARPLTMRAVVPITSPDTTLCTTVAPTFEVTRVRICTFPDPSFCRSGETWTVCVR
jgi:hypothetical protein